MARLRTYIRPLKSAYVDAGIATDWYRWNERTMAWDFNHRQDGHDPKQLKPKPLSDTQERVWKDARWKKTVEVLGSLADVSLETDQSP